MMFKTTISSTKDRLSRIVLVNVFTEITSRRVLLVDTGNSAASANYLFRRSQFQDLLLRFAEQSVS